MQSLMEMAHVALATFALRGPAGSPGSIQTASNSTSSAPTGATDGSPPQQHAGAPGSRASSVQPDTSTGSQALTRASSTGSTTRSLSRRARKDATEEEHEGTSSSSQNHD
jgi:hypothetical protein